MGIDIYLRWDGMTDEDQQQQVSGFFETTVGGHGYLRESYHGGPYATHILFREAFESETYEAEIPAAVLRERMDAVTEPARGCDKGHYFAMMMQEALNKLDLPKEVDAVPIVSAVASKIKACMEEEQPVFPPTTTPMTGREAIYTRCLQVYPKEGKEYADAVVESFEKFIELAEQKERETGKPCTVVASY